jgi:5-methylcytosine-specific restriction endonuclease McrA
LTSIEDKERNAQLRRNRYYANREAILEKRRQDRANDPERFREYGRNWAAKHKDLVKERDKKYREEHPDKIRVRIQRWTEKNPVKDKERVKRYYHSPKGQAAFARLGHIRRARESESVATLTGDEWVDILSCQNNRCAICNKKFTEKRRPTKDHIIPLSKGGNLTRENVQALCKSCNCKKSTKIDPNLIQSWISYPTIMQ